MSDVNQTARSGDVLLVTGGSRGIGAAVVRGAAKGGYAVCFSYREDAAAAQTLVKDIAAAAVHATGRMRPTAVAP